MNINTIRSNINNFYAKKKEEKQRERETQHNYNYSKYYQNKQWKALRNLYYIEHPLCECCEKMGIVSPTDEVHHKFPFMQGENEAQKYKLLLDYNNLLSLCKKHHILAHQYLNISHKDRAGIEEILQHEQNINKLKENS